MEPRNGSRYISWVAVIGVLVVIIGFLAAQGIAHVFTRILKLEEDIDRIQRERTAILLDRGREWAIMKERSEKMQLRDDEQDRRLDALEGRRK